MILFWPVFLLTGGGVVVTNITIETKAVLVGASTNGVLEGEN